MASAPETNCAHARVGPSPNLSEIGGGGGGAANNASARLTGIGYGPAEARLMIAPLGVAPTREARLEDDHG